MAFKGTFLASLALSGAALAYPSNQSKTSFSWQNTKHVIAFGDSYSFVQGTLGHPNATFIGDMQNLAFTKQQLLENKIEQDHWGTAEGGPNWLERLTGCGLQEGLTLPVDCDVQLWDFAYAGADISSKYTRPHKSTTIPLVNQTSRYITYGAPALAQTVVESQSLVTFWIGVNDILDTKDYPESLTNYPYLYRALIDIMFMQAVIPMYKAGYNNFLFMGLPPLDRRPGTSGLVQGTLNARPNATMVKSWDSILASRVQAFQASHRGSKAMFYDTNTFLNGVMNSPAEYGLKDVTGYCKGYNQGDVYSDPQKYGCNPMDTYFWYNKGHLTSKIHGLIAHEVESFLESQ